MGRGEPGRLLKATDADGSKALRDAHRRQSLSGSQRESKRRKGTQFRPTEEQPPWSGPGGGRGGQLANFGVGPVRKLTS